MKKIKMFEEFVNEFDLKDDQEDFEENPEQEAPTGYRNHSEADYVITSEDARKLIAADDENTAPGEEAPSEEDFQKSCDEITGLTLADYAEIRWPEEPQKQFDIALKTLNK